MIGALVVRLEVDVAAAAAAAEFAAAVRLREVEEMEVPAGPVKARAAFAALLPDALGTGGGEAPLTSKSKMGRRRSRMRMRRASSRPMSRGIQVPVHIFAPKKNQLLCSIKKKKCI